MTTTDPTPREGVLLTDAEIDELLAIHSRSDVRHALIDGPWCEADYDEWPCATVRALTNLRAARAERDELRETMKAIGDEAKHAVDNVQWLDPSPGYEKEYREAEGGAVEQIAMYVKRALADAAKGAGDGE